MTTAPDVSASELAFLDTMLPKRIAFMPDIAIVAKLTPSETKEIVTSLTGKNLIEQVDPYVVRITDRGEFVARSVRNRLTPTPRSDADPQEIEVAFRDALKELEV